MASSRKPTNEFCGSYTTTRRILITGGSGYLGFSLATAASKQSIEAVLLDITPPAQALPPGVHFVSGSVADAAAVDAAFASLRDGPLDAVFHVASYGMSGRELRDRAKITSVNVGGTHNVISACLRYGVPRLVYVSTCNVIFVGRPISGGDETAPYPPPNAYKDAYSFTKAQAERLVLEANGRLFECNPQFNCMEARAMERQQVRAAESGTLGHSDTVGNADVALHGHDELTNGTPKQVQQRADGDSRRLFTCSIRSTGIWGPGEARHQPRVIRMVRAGLFQATFGDPSSLSDWIHVDNLVQILILAERALRFPVRGCPNEPPLPGAPLGDGNGGGPSEPGPIAAGQVYYASDGDPINNFLHFKPFIVGLGYSYPALNVPFALVYGIAWLIEYAWPLLSHLMADPPLTRMEVDKCCIEHWFDITKARRELGYKPAAFDRGEVVRHMAAAGWAAGGHKQQQQMFGLNAMVLLAAAVMFIVAVVLAAVYGADGYR
ncbi:hypothetical protein Vafri_13123 [Volvox africanus]|uniref:3-beta hydroxysteroid dehydrogenase/isomerase domain-containing protein n=1 Tax=Volvox africanus TaxID=51714 RepID=A0A8J4BG07_9CHLO|nr:hypothetical protein Vafri_13123 [Volvox africanus]